MNVGGARRWSVRVSRLFSRAGGGWHRHADTSPGGAPPGLPNEGSELMERGSVERMIE